MWKKKEKKITCEFNRDYDDEIDKDHSKLIDSAMEEASERNYREDKVRQEYFMDH